MISQLTSLLANAANAGAGAVSSNVSSSNANVSHSVPSAVPTLSLAQAAALENAARVAVSRLPEQILSIQPLQSEKSASRVLTVSLPSNNAIKAVQNPQMVSLPSSSVSNSVSLLTSTSVQQHIATLPASQQNSLINAIAQTLATNDGAISLKGRVTVLSSGQLGLALSSGIGMANGTTSAQNNVIPLLVSTQTDKTALQAYLGQQVNLTVSTTSSQEIALKLTPVVSSATTSSSASAPLLPTTLKVSSNAAALQHQIIESGLKQGTVAVELNRTSPALLQQLLPTENQNTSNVLKSVALLSIKEGPSGNVSLTTHVAQNKAVLAITHNAITTPSSSTQSSTTFHQASLPAFPVLSNNLVKNVSLDALPKANIVEMSPVSRPANGKMSTSPQTNNISEVAAQTRTVRTGMLDPTALKGSDVHQAISQLSRALLSQTGSTNQALSQLLSIVNGAETTKADVARSNIASLDKVFQTLKSLDVSTISPAKMLGQSPSTSLASNNASLRPNTLTPVAQTGNAVTNDNRISISEILGTKVKQDTTHTNLGSLLNNLGLQAKNVSSDLISAVKHQFGHVMKETLATSVEKQLIDSDVNPRSKPIATGLENATAKDTGKENVARKENVLSASTKVNETASLNAGKALESQRVNTTRTAETAPPSIFNNTATSNSAPASSGEITSVLTTSKSSVLQGQPVAKAGGENINEPLKQTESLAISNSTSETEKQSANQNSSQTTAAQDLPSRLQSILTTNALLTTPINLTSPASNSNFVQGLVALVQLALAGRAMQRQPSLKSLIDAPESVVSKTLSNIGSTAQPSRVTQDLSQLDSRQQLLSQLKTLLANHQQSKIASADSRIQGQDSFYYVLPSLSQYQSPAELLIHREQERKQNDKKAENGRALWNVTMKLDIGDTGQVLAKSRIDKSSITIDLYASNEVILRRIADTMPYLTRRLTSLGLEVEKSSFQRGQIPETLKTRPHQIFETRV
ncbi:hypothetical protein KUL42_06600 [Alteromonas sp. KUL42]|uniref:flagellar hook-length control protein FliK n=1 Tax=Alteromonas sp. KUL42 TaxID=2480797 RepID=UPI001036664F|nr:flagellar hook-length control protein FliK [Alteromonas sp. KUL42]TAP37487.1 flagellar hook-length control protein FliK [Alteromonas sp. KUL42]GEA05899.1 hypothetical protein KUL42_06600 [Alteromonas sp. KUL42]